MSIQPLKHIPFLWRVDPPAHLSAWPHALLKHPASRSGAQNCQQEGEVYAHSQQCFSFKEITTQGDAAFPQCIGRGGPTCDTSVTVSSRNMFTWSCLCYELGAVMTCTQRLLFISHKITPLGPALQFSWSHFYFSTEPAQPLQLRYCGTAHEQQLLPK